MATNPNQRPGRTPPTLAAPPLEVMRRDAFYQTGTNDPSLAHDFGAGPWRSKSVTAAAIAERELILTILGLPTIVYPGPNATRHMRRYFDNNGRDYTIDLENMVKVVPSAKRNMVGEFRLAQAFVQTLPIGTHHFTARATRGGYNLKSENADWFFAVGGYTRWGKGVATITPCNIGRHYEVEFEYKFYDRYNWDGGKSVTIGGVTITDEFMAEFHREGLAREFDCYGSIDRHFAWDGDIAVPSDEAILTPSGRR